MMLGILLLFWFKQFQEAFPYVKIIRYKYKRNSEPVRTKALYEVGIFMRYCYLHSFSDIFSNGGRSAVDASGWQQGLRVEGKH